jgi:hypothetical protein
MGHPQPATPVQTDNSTAEGIIHSRVQPKRTKAMDMRFHWLRDRGVNQQQFRFFWRPGPLNYADYWTKHHPAAHHCNMRKEFLTPIKVLMELRKRKQQGPGDRSSPSFCRVVPSHSAPLGTTRHDLALLPGHSAPLGTSAKCSDAK